MARAGRKRKQGVKRVNGRISQRKDDVIARKQETEAQVTATAREARRRVFGIAMEDTMNPDTATVPGRLKRAKVINAGQLKAAYRYEACVMAYRSLIGGPKEGQGSPNASPAYLATEQERYARAKARYDGAVAAVLAENAIHKNRGCNMVGALDTIVMRDVDVPHLHGDLRLALNALSHYFGCVEEDEGRASEAA
jgi:hypothetical protein